MDFYEPGDDDAPGGNDPGDGGDDNGGGGGGHPTPPDPHEGDSRDKGRDAPKRNKPKGGSGPPDGGDDDGNGPDRDEEDDDEKFRRRMIKFLGGFVGQKSDDKPKVKEADTIKVPAFPLAETYCNWRIKTREAVAAASADPDSAFIVNLGTKIKHLKRSGRLRRLRH